MPKNGESFADTMQRAAQYGKTVTPQDVNDELKTAPRKAAEVLVAAPVMGASAVAIPDAIGALPGIAKSTVAWASANPIKAYLLFQVAKELGLGDRTTKLFHLVAGSE